MKFKIGQLRRLNRTFDRLYLYLDNGKISIIDFEDNEIIKLKECIDEYIQPSDAYPSING